MNSEFFFSPSACICAICGQFRIRLRLAAEFILHFAFCILHFSEIRGKIIAKMSDSDV